MADAGAAVTGVDLTAERLSAAAEGPAPAGVAFTPVAADVTDAGVDAVMAATLDAHGALRPGQRGRWWARGELGHGNPRQRDRAPHGSHAPDRALARRDVDGGTSAKHVHLGDDNAPIFVRDPALRARITGGAEASR